MRTHCSGGNAIPALMSAFDPLWMLERTGGNWNLGQTGGVQRFHRRQGRMKTVTFLGYFSKSCCQPVELRCVGYSLRPTSSPLQSLCHACSRPD
jgi:hypothetical protein